MRICCNDSYRVKWTRPFGTEAWSEGGLDTYALEQEISGVMDQLHFEDVLESYIVYIKSHHSRATRQRLDLTDLSVDSWARIESSMRYQHRLYLGYELHVVLECLGRADLRPDLMRSSASMDSPMSPASRRTRTVQQEEQQAYRRDQNEAAGDHSEELLTIWACESSKCGNEHGMCFVAFDNNHYAISSTQKLAWAQAISRATEGASTHNPPNSLYKYLVQNQKAVGSTQQSETSKKTRQQMADERFDRLMEMQERQQEQAMMRETLNMTRSSAVLLYMIPYSLSNSLYSLRNGRMHSIHITRHIRFLRHLLRNRRFLLPSSSSSSARVSVSTYSAGHSSAVSFKSSRGGGRGGYSNSRFLVMEDVAG